MPTLYPPLVSIVQEYDREFQFADHKEFLDKNINDTKAIIRYCFDLLKDDQQNGVSCFLNLLLQRQDKDSLEIEKSEDLRKDLLDRIEKQEPLLAAYYKKINEWDSDYGKKISRLRMAAEPDEHIPRNLLHALDVKILLNEYYELANEFDLGDQSSEEEKRMLPYNNKLIDLLQKSSLHLNFSGSRFAFIKFQFKDARMLNFSNFISGKCDFTGSNFSKSDFTRVIFFGCILTSCNFSNAIIDSGVGLRLSKSQDISFNSANLKGTFGAIGEIRNQSGMDLRHADLKEAKFHGLENQHFEMEQYLTELINFIVNNEPEFNHPQYTNLINHLLKNGYDLSGMIKNQDDPQTQNDATTLFWLRVDDDRFNQRVSSLQEVDLLDLSLPLQKALKTVKASLSVTDLDISKPKP